NNDENMKVTFSTLAGLEIFPRFRETESQSILGFMNKTKTSMGSRYLRQYFQTPSSDIHTIMKRLDLIEGLIKKNPFLKNLRAKLDNIRDMDRIMAKVSTQKVTAGDMINM